MTIPDSRVTPSRGTVYKFLTIAALSLAIPLGVAQAETCQHHIIYLPQTHRSPTDNSHQFRPEMESGSHSQFLVARYIRDNKELPVFTEQAPIDFALSDLPQSQRETTVHSLQATFPSGLPFSYAELSDEQKYQLVDLGGDAFSLVSGTIPILHRTVENMTEWDANKPALDWIAAHPNERQYPPEISKLIYEDRERHALTQINNYIALHPEQRDVVLVYGGNHNFTLYPDLFPPACVAIPPDFQSAWNGWNRSSDHNPYLGNTTTAPATQVCYSSPLGNYCVAR